MSAIRIESVRKATLNGRRVKIFKAYIYCAGSKAYIFEGEFSCPENTPDNMLPGYVNKN